LIGSNLLVLLANSPGCEKVRVVDLRPPSPDVVRGIEDKVEFVEGRFGPGTYDRLLEAAKGTDCVFMVFTPHVMHATSEEFYSTNVTGVNELTRACVDAGVRRIIQTSSIAISHMFVESFNQAESVPFPAIETYQSPYDISKRQGEEIVLAASSLGKVRTCSIRAGGVLLGPRDFLFSNVWPIIPGVFIVPLGKPVDWIDGRDVSRAMLLAAQALQERPRDVEGQAFWVTGIPVQPGEVARITAGLLRYPFVPLPMIFAAGLCFALRVAYYAMRLLGCRVPGVRPDQIVSAAFYQKTFDNSKVRKALGFEAKFSLEESCSRVVDLYLQENGRSRGPQRFITFVLCSGLAPLALASAAMLYRPHR